MIKNWESFNESYERLTHSDIMDIEELASEGMSASEITIEMNHKDYIEEADVQKVIDNMKLHESVDTSFVIAKVTDMFSKEDVSALLNKEKKEWADSVSEYDSNNNGEAEDVVLDYIIDKYEKEHEDLGENRESIETEVKKEYSL